MKNKMWKHSLIYLGLLFSYGLFNSTTFSKTFSVNSFEDIDDETPGDGDCAIADTGDCTLRAAVSEANALEGPDTIILQEGTYPITGAMGDDINQEGDIDISSDLTIQGEGARKTILSRQGDGRVLHLVNGKVSLLDLTISNGNLASMGLHGAGIYFEGGGELKLAYVTVTNNESQEGNGGGIYSEGGSLVIENSTISKNKANKAHGGGIYILQGDFQLNGSTVSENQATGGGSGGGIYAVPSANSTINYSTIILNRSGGQGGGV